MAIMKFMRLIPSEAWKVEMQHIMTSIFNNLVFIIYYYPKYKNYNKITFYVSRIWVWFMVNVYNFRLNLSIEICISHMHFKGYISMDKIIKTYSVIGCISLLRLLDLLKLLLKNVQMPQAVYIEIVCARFLRHGK